MTSALQAAWTILRLTLREAVRRRMLLALFGLSTVAVLLTAWGYGELPNLRDGGSPRGISPEAQLRIVASQLLIGVTFMFSFVMALFAVLAAAPAIAGARDSGELQAIAARPVPRAAILLGKWAALAIVVVAYAAFSGTAELAAVGLLTGYVPPAPVAAIAFVAGEGLVVLSLTFLLGTWLSAVTSGVVAMLVFGIAWLGGVIGGIGAAFGDEVTSMIAPVIALIVPSDGLWRGAIYSLEHPDVLVAGTLAGPQASAFPFFAREPASMAFIAWCLVWVAAVLVGAVANFARNDL